MKILDDIKDDIINAFEDTQDQRDQQFEDLIKMNLQAEEHLRLMMENIDEDLGELKVSEEG